jgi:hypothetical protein
MAAAALALLIASGAAAQAPPSVAPPGGVEPESVWALPLRSGDVPTTLSLQTRYGGLVQQALEPEGPAKPSRTGGGHAGAGSYGDILLPLGRGWIPYAGADLSIVLRESDRGGDSIGVVVSPRIGLTWLVREYFSVDANVFMAWSTGEVFGANAQSEDQEHGLRLRLQIEF